MPEKEKADVTQEELLDFDLADEAQIMAELKGEHFETDRFIYELRKSGKFQLTYNGVKLACRKLAEQGEAIKIVGSAVCDYDPQNPEYFRVQVQAQRVLIDKQSGREIVLESVIGAKRRWLKEKLTDGTIRHDEFFYEKTISQAQRNAKQALLPQNLITQMIEMFKKGNAPGGQPGKSVPQKTQQAPPPQGNGGAQTAKSEDKKVPPADAKKMATLRQQFWGVLKSAAGTKEEAPARVFLKKLLGVEQVSALSEAQIMKLGPMLRKVQEGENAAREIDGKIVLIHLPSSTAVWPEGYKLPEEAPAGAGAQAEAPLF